MKKAFTLIEIMIVVAIIGLLAAMAIPAFQKVREAHRIKAQVQAPSSNQNWSSSWSGSAPTTSTQNQKKITIDGKTYRLVPE